MWHCTTTGMSKNRSKSCTRKNSTVICTVCTVGTRLCTHNRNVQPLSMNWIWGTSNQRTAGTCRCMTAGTEEELLEDAARPAPNHVTSRQASRRSHQSQDAHSGHRAPNTRKARTQPPSSSASHQCGGPSNKAPDP